MKCDKCGYDDKGTGDWAHVCGPVAVKTYENLEEFDRFEEFMANESSSLKHTKGNLLDLAEAGLFDVVVQGCNCFNTMGGGIAREIRERFPAAAEVDEDTIRGDYNKLGNWSEVTIFGKNEFTIINAYTQYNMSKGEDVFEYIAFELILQKLVKQYGNKKIGFPYIGMGLAGGNKDVIIAMLEYYAQEVVAKGGSMTLVEFG